MEEAGTVGAPGEVINIRWLTCGFPASFEWRPTSETGVNAPLVVIGSESIQLAMQVEAVPEEGVVEILAPKGSDQSLDERMRARRKRDGLAFLDVENSQIRPPAMKAEQRVIIGTEARGKRLSAPGLVQHAADANAVDMCGFDTESDDAAREDVHHNHYPETLQQDRLAAEQIDAQQAIAGFSDGREPRRTFASRLWERVVRQYPAHLRSSDSATTERAPPRSHGPDCRDDQMSHQNEPIPHAANHARSWRCSQVYDSAADCGGIAIRHGHRGSACGQCETAVAALDGTIEHNDHYLSAEPRLAWNPQG
ncbi:MAG: hypothetical protein ABI885_20800 [Gammaproteobacteria bacterium]